MAKIEETTPPVRREWALKLDEVELEILYSLLNPAGGIRPWAYDEGFDEYMAATLADVVSKAHLDKTK